METQKPIVSIIVPTYNSQNYIENAIDSLLMQTYKNIEIIIVDDYCVDNTVDFLKKKYFRIKSITIIEKKNNSGPANSRNIGIELSQGKYIALLDSDDYYSPNKIEKQVNFLEENPKISACSTYLKNFGLLDNIVKFPLEHTNIKNQSLVGCPIAHPATIFRTSFLNKYKIRYNETFIFSEDYELFNRMLQYQDCYFATISEPLYYYRISGNQASFSKKNGKIVVNNNQQGVTKKIQYNNFSKILPDSSTLYEKKWVDTFFDYNNLESYDELKTFVLWSKKVIENNDSTISTFDSYFLQNIIKKRVVKYFLIKKKLSWHTLFQVLFVYSYLKDIDLKYKTKYIIKCLLFLIINLEIDNRT